MNEIQCKYKNNSYIFQKSQQLSTQSVTFHHQTQDIFSLANSSQIRCTGSPITLK